MVGLYGVKILMMRWRLWDWSRIREEAWAFDLTARERRVVRYWNIRTKFKVENQISILNMFC